jgi:hypothetical protein
MAPFTVSTRGVVLGGKAGSSLHSDLQELGRDDVKGALRVDASTNVKDTDLVFTTTDHTVRTVSPERTALAPTGGGGEEEKKKKHSKGHASPSSARARALPFRQRRWRRRLDCSRRLLGGPVLALCWAAQVEFVGGDEKRSDSAHSSRLPSDQAVTRPRGPKPAPRRSAQAMPAKTIPRPRQCACPGHV